MNFSQQNKLAHELGAFYENGYWRFPSVAVKDQFERIVAGLEWSPKQTAQAHAALLTQRDALKAGTHVAMEASE